MDHAHRLQTKKNRHKCGILQNRQEGQNANNPLNATGSPVNSIPNHPIKSNRSISLNETEIKRNYVKQTNDKSNFKVKSKPPALTKERA